MGKLPVGRAHKDPYKDKVLEVLAATWKKYPDLRLGELLAIVSGENTSESKLYRIEDGPLQLLLEGFDGKISNIKCGAYSPSRELICTLDIDHLQSSHVNLESGIGWRRY